MRTVDLTRELKGGKSVQHLFKVDDTRLLLGLLTGLILWFGGYAGGQTGIMFAFVFAMMTGDPASS